MSNKTIGGIVKINLKQSKIAYFVTLISFFLGSVSVLVNVLVDEADGAMPVGNYLILLALLLPILVPALNFTKLMNLGCKRLDFFKACVITYAPVACAVSLVCVLLRITLDKITFASSEYDLNLLSAFGFTNNGPIVAFVQMSAFLFFVCCLNHTLTLIQGHWYGWIADALLISIISVFTPIAPLRAALVWFFNLIIFHDIAFIQIFACIVLGLVIYCTSLIPIRMKKI
jgi:hypothetical protein